MVLGDVKAQTWLDLFRLGSQVGLKPDEVLDMNLEVLRSVVQGYEDRLFDQQLIAVHAGFWAGYYGRSKKPRPLKAILENMLRKKKESPQQHATEVDVETFLAREQRRLKATKAK